MLIDEEDYLAHYGTPRHSGRYPWGSGENPRNGSFLDHVNELKRQGLSEVEIARGLGISTTELRAKKSIAKNEQKQADIAMAQSLRDKGYSNTAIGERMNKNESSVRALLAPGAKDKADILQATTDVLRQQIAEKKYLDVGVGTELHMGVSDTTLKTAIAVLKEEGYPLYYVKTPQLGTTNDTSQKILVAPGTPYSEVYANRDNIRTVTNFSEDMGRTYLGLHPPLAVDPKRVGINYKEQGGDQADGVIYVRPGVEDVSLGNARYAQVRVQVGEGHYLKGMAVYKDDLPDGVDLLFNTNKSDTGNKLDALKKLSDDPDNPFGAVVRQRIIRDADGNERNTSAMNIVTGDVGWEDGERSWKDWSKTLSSQMLSKQSPSLAKSQLDETYKRKVKEFEEISALTNPVVRKQLLEKFGDETDSSAVHLEAAGLPRQAYHVILPVNSMKPNEVYAPNFKDGERVALIRFPHAGTFEIPDLTVNNNQREAKSLLGQAKDAIGIHHSVAERLSGADFDGDTVLVIPNNSGKISITPALEGLKNFDPRSSYPAYEGMPKMTARQKGIEMGSVSNLITDMTLRKASTSELARAVRHSMVVIDAEKHHLNYKLSAEKNNIAELKAKYQGGANRGAATLISRATAETRVLDRKPRPMAEGGPIDKATGKRVFVETGEKNFKTGADKKIKSTRLAETDDALTLSSGTRMEKIYADHSNRLKTLANLARRESVNIPRSSVSPSAKKVYSAEVTSLNSKLAIALRNAPLERQAQVLANATVRAKRNANPNMDAATLKKIKAQALEEARRRVDAKKQQIHITDKEWEAIQAGAVSDSKLSSILSNADLARVRELATPRSVSLMSPGMETRARQMLARGESRADVAAALGVSVSTLDRSTEGGG